MIDEDLYPQYCKHNNPIHYQNFCIGCRIEREQKQKQRYEEYLNQKYGNKRFNPFTHEFIDEDLTSEIENEDFKPLRKSKSFEELKKSYHKLCREYHPDKGGDEEKFKNLNNLYHNLELRFR